jgi:hypothetical protein
MINYAILESCYAKTYNTKVVDNGILYHLVKQVFPMAEQRECFRHLMENMKKRFSGSTYGGQYMWPAARAYTEEKF